MTDREKSAQSGASQDRLDGAAKKPIDEAYAEDIAGGDARNDEQVKGGMYKKLQQQIGEQ